MWLLVNSYGFICLASALRSTGADAADLHNLWLQVWGRRSWVHVWGDWPAPTVMVSEGQSPLSSSKATETRENFLYLVTTQVLWSLEGCMDVGWKAVGRKERPCSQEWAEASQTHTNHNSSMHILSKAWQPWVLLNGRGAIMPCEWAEKEGTGVFIKTKNKKKPQSRKSWTSQAMCNFLNWFERLQYATMKTNTMFWKLKCDFLSSSWNSSVGQDTKKNLFLISQKKLWQHLTPRHPSHKQKQKQLQLCLPAAEGLHGWWDVMKASPCPYSSTRETVSCHSLSRSLGMMLVSPCHAEFSPKPVPTLQI